MTAPEPKTCPFCLGKAEVFYIANHEGGLARCADADCIGNRAYGKVSAWNRRADLAAVQSTHVRVKPLVWEEPCYTNNWINVARSVFGDYYISIDGGRHSAWLEANVKPYENKIGDDVGSVIEAMMLAETDYQARMQPLIKTQPDPRDEVIARLVDAATHLCDGIATMLPPLGQSDRVLSLRAALAAAKAVQK